MGAIKASYYLLSNRRKRGPAGPRLRAVLVDYLRGEHEDGVAKGRHARLNLHADLANDIGRNFMHLARRQPWTPKLGIGVKRAARSRRTRPAGPSHLVLSPQLSSRPSLHRLHTSEIASSRVPDIGFAMEIMFSVAVLGAHLASTCKNGQVDHGQVLVNLFR